MHLISNYNKGGLMANATRGARPIKDLEIKEHYDSFAYTPVSLPEYADVWRNWLTYTTNKSILGLDNFAYADYTQGTSQTFDQFALRNAGKNPIIVLNGEFQYHACISKHLDFKSVDPDEYFFSASPIPIQRSAALIISNPFSDYGCTHPYFESIMDICNDLDISVCLDLAYWGISKGIDINLNNYPAIKEVTCSLSKPFYTLENHRVGIRFTRDYVDDGISMINEVSMQNTYSMSLGVHYMRHFGPDWMWEKYRNKYEKICSEQELIYTDTVIFGLGDETRHKQYSRGVPHNYRVCISEFLGDIK